MKQVFFISLTCISFFIVFSAFSQDDISGIAGDVVIQTNQFRKSEGLAGLVDRKDLDEIAQKHSEDMASGRVAFGHDGFDERNELAKKKINGLHSFAENVAYGASSAEQVMNLWKNSQGHRRNMLGQYIYIGTGVAKDNKGQLFYTQVFAD